MKRLWLVVAAAALISCGYRPVYAGTSASERLSVVAAPSRVAVPAALLGVLSAVKSELSAAGALRGGSGYPRLVVEVLRVDESAGGIVASEGANGRLAAARGSIIAVTARGWVEISAGTLVQDSGDVRRTAQVASSTAASVDADGYVSAAAQAGRYAGTAIARRILGAAEPGYGPL